MQKYCTKVSTLTSRVLIIHTIRPLWYYISMPDKLKKFWRSLGPGFITGASDNDPAGIATYAIAGAKAGLSMLWAIVYIVPLMVVIQKMSAHIGRLSSCGLAGNIKKFYPAWLLVPTALIIITANTLNVGANIYGMASALNLLLPVNEELLAVLMSALMVFLTIKLRYAQIVSIFKWLAISMGLYVVAFFTIDADWGQVIRHALIPTIKLDKEFITILFAVLGTSLAPYMFFWQASEEAEEMRDSKPRIRICKFRDVDHSDISKIDTDTKVGMTFSNVISFFIVALMGSTLFRTGGAGVESLAEIAGALEPFAGKFAYLLFTVGIIGSGFLAIPILAGSAGYVLAELFGWERSLDKPFSKARQFYIVISVSIFVGLVIPFTGLSPVQALFYASVINGLAAPFLLMLMIHMASNPKIVGEHKISGIEFVIACIAVFVMTAGAIFILIS